MEKICVVCGAKFETARTNKKYCSFCCREAGQLLRRARWEAAHPHYDRDYARRRKNAKEPNRL